MSELLEVVVTRQDAPPKPAPDGLHLALNQLSVGPQHAVLVGDSPADMTGARAAGVLALGAGCVAVAEADVIGVVRGTAS
ncbi:HAD-IA family hydrolase [Streptomyces sp. REN17]|uniref:HAD family hydrolase n=1 Tax=Streptomyces beigongshangae TaxID=2841597 RepID=UPI001C854ADA